MRHRELVLLLLSLSACQALLALDVREKDGTDAQGEAGVGDASDASNDIAIVADASGRDGSLDCGGDGSCVTTQDAGAFCSGVGNVLFCDDFTENPIDPRWFRFATGPGATLATRDITAFVTPPAAMHCEVDVASNVEGACVLGTDLPVPVRRISFDLRIEGTSTACARTNGGWLAVVRRHFDGTAGFEQAVLTTDFSGRLRLVVLTTIGSATKTNGALPLNFPRNQWTRFTLELVRVAPSNGRQVEARLYQTGAGTTIAGGQVSMVSVPAVDDGGALGGSNVDIGATLSAAPDSVTCAVGFDNVVIEGE